MSHPVRHFMLTVAETDPTTTDTDVIAAAEVNSVHEVYPDDADPVWITPQAAAALSPAAVAVLLDALEVGIEGAYDEGANPAADEVVGLIQHLRANVSIPVPVVGGTVLVGQALYTITEVQGTHLLLDNGSRVATACAKVMG